MSSGRGLLRGLPQRVRVSAGIDPVAGKGSGDTAGGEEIKKIPAPGPGYQNKGMAIKIKTHYGVCKLADNERTLGWLHAPLAFSRQTLQGRDNSVIHVTLQPHYVLFISNMYVTKAFVAK